MPSQKIIPISSEQLRQTLAQYSRQPMLDLLAELIEAKPTHEAMQEAFNRNPAMFFQSLAVAQKSAGYKDEISVHHRVVHELSEKQVNEEIAEIRRKLLAEGAIDAEFTEAQN